MNYYSNDCAGSNELFKMEKWKCLSRTKSVMDILEIFFSECHGYSRYIRIWEPIWVFLAVLIFDNKYQNGQFYRVITM